jgi:hypothetical protein
VLTTIPLTIAARNEAAAIEACLDALAIAIEVCETALPVRIDPWVVADDCTDATAALAEARGVHVLHSHGGKVEAQRAGLRPGPFQIFCDADILVTRDTLLVLCTAMLERPEIWAAFPPKRPLPPRRRGLLPWALHVYNAKRGFSSQRTWLSGKLFAIRRWSLPTHAQVQQRAAQLPPSLFYDYDAGMRIDDVYLSRSVVAEHGPDALHETRGGEISFRAPETLRGMYRYYRRMRMEIERVDRLWPETCETHRRFGRRAPDQLAGASAGERAAWYVFAAALLGCRVTYRLERAWYEHLASRPLAPWPPIPETKDLSCDSASPT